MIWREVELANKVKPVVVSMGDVAASGGYYISAPATKIFAEPTTITGSIGVFGIIPNMQGFFNNKLGITFDGEKTHKYADMMTVSRPLTDAGEGHHPRVRGRFLQRIQRARCGRSENDRCPSGQHWPGPCMDRYRCEAHRAGG